MNNVVQANFQSHPGHGADYRLNNSKVEKEPTVASEYSVKGTNSILAALGYADRQQSTKTSLTFQNGLTRASSQLSNGISICQIAESALKEVQTNLQRVHELTIDTNNGLNSPHDEHLIQAEVDLRLSAIDNIATRSNFKGMELFSGNFKTAIQVDDKESEVIEISLNEIRLASLNLSGFLANSPNGLETMEKAMDKVAQSVVAIGTTHGRFKSIVKSIDNTLTVAASLDQAEDSDLMTSVAGRALVDIRENIQRIQGLTIRAQGGLQSPQSVSFIQTEVDQRLTEIDRLAEHADFNGVRLLGGDFAVRTKTVDTDEAETSIRVPQTSVHTLQLAGLAVENPQSLKTLGQALEQIDSSLDMLHQRGYYADTRSLGLSTEINGLREAVDNVGNAMSAIQLAQLSFGQIKEKLLDAREQTINAGSPMADKSLLQSSVDASLSELDRIASQTRFGDIELLTGKFAARVQTGDRENDFIDVGIDEISTSALNLSAFDVGSRDALSTLDRASNRLDLIGLTIDVAQDGLGAAYQSLSTRVFGLGEALLKSESAFNAKLIDVGLAKVTDALGEVRDQLGERAYLASMLTAHTQAEKARLLLG